MARQISMETLNAKIEKAEQNVARTKKAYEAATEELKKLMDKRDAVKRDEIVNAIIKSPGRAMTRSWISWRMKARRRSKALLTCRRLYCRSLYDRSCRDADGNVR